MSDTYEADTTTWCDRHADTRTTCGCPYLEPAEREGDTHGQVRIAYRLAREHRGRILHVHGLGWHTWDGTRWVEDQRGAATRAVLDTLRIALAESLTDKDLRADVRRCESASGVRGVLDIAAALPAFACTIADLDADPYLLNVANGTYDLSNHALRPHNPADRITKVCAAAWDPDATGPAWARFLATSLPDTDVRGFLQRYVGHALVGTVLEHHLAILTGAGRNGKGVFYGAVAHALGDYAVSAEPDLFMHRDGAHPTGEMDLRGARWVVVSESDRGRRLAEATVKRLTGGDRIRARRMRQDFVEFPASHTAALVTNHLPKVSGDDPALWSRLRVVPFDVVVPEDQRDPHLPEKLQLEADAVLAWAIDGWSEYRTGGLADPDAVTRATSDYQTASDAVARFLAERCFTSGAVSVKFADLYAEWVKWQTDEGADPMSRRAFGDALDKTGHASVRGSGNVAYRQGVALRVESEDEPWS